MIRTDWDEIASEQVLLLRVLRNRRSRETCYASGEAALAARRDGLVPPSPGGGRNSLEIQGGLAAPRDERNTPKHSPPKR